MGTINKEEILAGLGKIAVLFGGCSAEREVSLEGGRAVITSLENLGVSVDAIDVGDDLVAKLIESKPAQVFNMLHGRGGEDGVLQGVLEYLDIPYTGSGVLASALALDKVRTKRLWLQHGLATANFELLEADSDWQAVISRLGKSVVKPVNEGSSLGISVVETADELAKAYADASAFKCAVMAESYIDGEEFSVGILSDETLPIIQLYTSQDRSFFDFHAKYVDEGTQVICPAELNKDDTESMRELVLKAYHVLGCEGLVRIDVMKNKAGDTFLLEANTVPGMTEHSFVPMAAKVAGIEFDELMLRILSSKKH